MKEQKSAPVTRERIIGSSWDLLREEGIENFTMRKLAQKLDIKAASIYWHFQSKQHIFQFLANEIAERVLLYSQPDGGWKDQLYVFGAHFRTQLRKYPCSAELMAKTVPLGAEYVALINHMLAMIEPLPLDDRTKFSSIACVLNYILFFELDRYQQEKNHLAMRTEAVAEAESPFKLSPEHLPNPLRRMYQNDVFKELGSDSMFQTGFTILLSGIEQLSLSGTT